MSYVRDTLTYIKFHGPVTNKQIADGIKATRQQARDAIAQLTASGRIQNTDPARERKTAQYVITEFGQQSLECGSFKRWVRPEPAKLIPIPNVGVVAHAMRTQPVSVWRLAA